MFIFMFEIKIYFHSYLVVSLMCFEITKSILSMLENTVELGHFNFKALIKKFELLTE